jgi:hypothetical protein
MSLSDFLRGKGKQRCSEKIPGGEKVSAANKEEFMTLCQDLSKDFEGVVRLYSRTEGKKYSAALLLDCGIVIGATLEESEGGHMSFKEKALENIKSKLAGTSGDLEVYAFTEEDIETVKTQNPEVMLEKPVDFSSLQIKIRLNLDAEEEFGKAPASKERSVKVKQFRVGSKFNLTEFARGLPGGIPAIKVPDIKIADLKIPEGGQENHKRKFPEIDMKLKLPTGNLPPLTAAKIERLAEIKKQRQKEDLELMKRISQITTKKPVEQKVVTSCKVETTIDHLYQIVQKQGKLKIDDNLSTHLGVPRPQIESWALILEEHNLVELHYPAIGEPEIRKKDDKK